MRILLINIFLFLTLVVFGQKEYELYFSTPAYRVLKKNPVRKFKDSTAAFAYVNDLRFFGIKKGYLLASLDTLVYKPGRLEVGLYVGPQFGNARLTLNDTDLQFFRKTKTANEKLLNNLDFSPAEISRLLLRMQQDLENNGYPFASVGLENLQMDSLTLTAEIAVKRGAELRWTKINLQGENLTSVKLISSYIHIRKGDLYNQSEVRLISSRLKQISFLEEVKPSEVLFTKEGAELFLYLKSKPVSLANGVIGLQPNPKTNAVSLTGELRLKLVNILKKAELIDINWRSIQAQTQSLKAQVTAPNLFQTPFGLDGQFQLYKRDTSFLELKSTFGIQYSLNNGSYLKAFYRNNSSSVLKGGKNNPSFANLGSVQTNAYGLALFRQSLDYLPNPRKGMNLLIDVSIGKRKSRANDTSEVLTQTTYRGEFQLNWFVPIAKRHVLRLANQSEFYIAPVFYQNEVSRFGGQISQRGFNEDELSATTRTVFTAEYRFLVDQNSFAFVFFDQSWYENRSNNYYKDTPYGFGAGFSFGTNIGTFSISYGLGKQFSNPILLKDGKVHFGYIAYF